MAFDPQQLQLVREIGRDQMIFTCAPVPGGSRVYYGGSDGLIYELDVAAEPAEVGVFPSVHTSYIGGLVLAGDQLISGAWDGQLIWWNTATRECIRQVAAHTKWIRCLALSPDGQRLASVGDDMVCRLWQVSDGQLLHELHGHALLTPNDYPSMLFVCTFSPDGQYLATADKVGHIIVWDVASGQQAAAWDAPTFYTWDPVQRRHSIGGVRALAFSPDGAQLAVGGIDKIGNIDHLDGLSRLEIHDWRTGEMKQELSFDQIKGLVEHLQFSPDGVWLMVLGGDNGGFLYFYHVSEASVKKQEKLSVHMNELSYDAAQGTLVGVGNQRLFVWKLPNA